LRVATKEVPPFAMRMPDGSWTGISIQLWKQFALEADLEYQLIEMELHELLDALEQGNVDAGVAALTIAADREELFDFSHPFVISGLALAVRPNEGSAWGAALDRLLDEGFVRGFALGLLALAITSVVVWRLEARKNPEQFGGVVSGIGSALWWSVVTMTTVGYGDKAPATVPGRLLAVVWMIAGLILISALTATITSALTVSQLSSIQGPSRSPRARTTYGATVRARSPSPLSTNASRH
jgi:ABC-type amino acid transport substrate-binding protein